MRGRPPLHRPRVKHGVDPALLGVVEPFTDGELRRIDDRLGLPAELRTTG